MALSCVCAVQHSSPARCDSRRGSAFKETAARTTMTDLIDGIYVNAAGARNYKLYAATPLPETAPPLFVMLHGCDQDAAGFAAGTRMNEIADECHGVVLYPEQCRMVNPLGCWNWHDIKHQSAENGEP